MPKVSVIIPVYNTERYIGRCVRSLFEQTLDDIEYIFINDCSTDRSFDVLKKIIEEYPNRRSQIKIFNNAQNLGSASSRNIGLNNVTGEYITMVDSDDSLENDGLQYMYETAKENHLDILYANIFYNYSDGKIEERNMQRSSNSIDCTKALMMDSIDHQNGDKLFRTSFINNNNIRYIDGQDLAEDWSFCIRAFAVAKRIDKMGGNAYYHYYQDNPNSIMHEVLSRVKIQERILQQNKNIDAVIDFLCEKKMIDVYANEVLRIKKYARDFYFHDFSASSLKKWVKKYSDTNPLYLNDVNSKYKSRFLLWILSKGFVYTYISCIKMSVLKSKMCKVIKGLK